MLPNCEQYVFGFSTGHVGTTTLSVPNTYTDSDSLRVSDVKFLFEIDSSVVATDLT